YLLDVVVSFCLLLLLPPPTPSLFPYTTLFRSCVSAVWLRTVPRKRTVFGMIFDATPPLNCVTEITPVSSGLSERLTSDCTPCTKDRKSTRLNSSHVKISYAVFCLKKKKNKI